MVRTGADIIASGEYDLSIETGVSLLANEGSVSSRLRHTVDILRDRGAKLRSIFGPQHGFRGETQANMIEWRSYTDPELGIPVYSLYGEERSPSDEMMEGTELLIIDLQDVGTRCYTYVWTAVLMIEACAERSIPVLILDRPNPIGGELVEGPMLEKGYHSFVGLYPLPLRHGMTMAEMLRMVNSETETGCDLQIVSCTGWERDEYFSDTSLPWVLPSPNMPSPATAVVYPGTIMLEGTNLSEGRGTTLPFEIIGAPYLDPRSFVQALSACDIEGVLFRPLHFRPAWDKHAGELCGGVQLHITDRGSFRPVRTGACILNTAAELYPDEFRFLPPPYEYETEHPPIDIISGSPRLREAIQNRSGLRELFESWTGQEERFRDGRERYLIY